MEIKQHDLDEGSVQSYKALTTKVPSVGPESDDSLKQPGGRGKIYHGWRTLEESLGGSKYQRGVRVWDHITRKSQKRQRNWMEPENPRQNGCLWNGMTRNERILEMIWLSYLTTPRSIWPIESGDC